MMSALTANHQDMIDEIMDNFDFERCEKVMRALNWQIAKNGYDIDKPMSGQMYSPDVSDLRRSARRLLRQVIEENCYAVATGGFRVTWHEGNLELLFTVAEWESCGDS